MGTVIIADYGEICTRQISIRKIGISLIVGLKITTWMSSMIMVGILYSNMTIRPETQHKSRSVAMAQAEMTENREYQHKREPSSEAT